MKPANEDPNEDVVCGCDDINYWNASVAGSHGMATKAAGECASVAQCGGFAGKACPPGALCNQQVMPNECNAADISGTCWAVPSQCGGRIGFGPNSTYCNGSVKCGSLCAAIKSGKLWYTDASCPQ
jgi:hypothetical protein